MPRCPLRRGGGRTNSDLCTCMPVYGQTPPAPATVSVRAPACCGWRGLAHAQPVAARLLYEARSGRRVGRPPVAFPLRLLERHGYSADRAGPPDARGHSREAGRQRTSPANWSLPCGGFFVHAIEQVVNTHGVINTTLSLTVPPVMQAAGGSSRAPWKPARAGSSRELHRSSSKAERLGGVQKERASSCITAGA